MDCRQPLSDRNLVGSFLLEERVTEQRLTPWNDGYKAELSNGSANNIYSVGKH